MDIEPFLTEITNDPDDLSRCAQMMATTDPWITLGVGYEICLKAFEGECRETYVVRFGREIAGFVVLQVCGSFSGYIQTICIGDKFRNRGLGTNLLEFCEKRILEFSPNIFICVSTFNEGAIKLYKKFGFKLVGELENFVANGFTELLLRKTVGPRVGYEPSGS
jgi:ribosomal protein S18 acetylase RimI-like enzyme